MKFIILFRRRDRSGAPVEAAAVQADSFEQAMDPYGRFKRCSLLYALTEMEAGELIRGLQNELSGPVGAWYPVRPHLTAEELKEITIDPRATDEKVLQAFLNTEIWKESDIPAAIDLIREERPAVYASIEAYAMESTRYPMEKYGVTTEKTAKCPICGSDLNTETTPPTCPKCGTSGIEKKSEDEDNYLVPMYGMVMPKEDKKP